jgi:2-polyprenyl-3-methyl-5-hydroxy-6-metoxy-1,4-benzoquinol methylase
LNKTNWLNYWDKKNIWTKSDLWKRNIELFFQKTSNIFDYDKKNTVLDIGCGNGDFANKILDSVDQVFCVDTSQEYINICKARFSNIKNINVLKLDKNYTDLSFIKNVKFSIIIANSVVQYYNSQKEIIDLVKSVQKIATQNAHFLISDMEVLSNKKKTYFKLIYNSVMNGYFFSLIKMGLRLIVNKEYSKTIQNQPLLIVNLDKLIQDLSIFVKKVTIINENITINVDRKHLLIQL